MRTGRCPDLLVAEVAVTVAFVNRPFSPTIAVEIGPDPLIGTGIGSEQDERATALARASAPVGGRLTPAASAPPRYPSDAGAKRVARLYAARERFFAFAERRAGSRGPGRRGGDRRTRPTTQALPAFTCLISFIRKEASEL